MILTIELWVIIGIALCCLEIFTGLFVSLAFGLAAFVIAALLYFFPSTLNWYTLLFVYGCIGLLTSLLLWRLFNRRNNNPDINDQ